MKLLEHHAKQLIGRFGVAVNQGVLVDSPDEAGRNAMLIEGPVVLKAQVPIGGRGKAGAVKFANTPDEAVELARTLFEMNVRGHAVKWVSVERMISLRREYYAGITWDTAAKLPVALFSDAGGISVETAPQLARRHFDPRMGLESFEGRELAKEMGLKGKALVALGQLLCRLSQAFLACDATTMELNPVVETDDGEWLGLDARVEIDDDAMGRQRAQLAFIGSAIDATVGGRPQTSLESEAQRIDAMDHRGVAGRVVEFEGDMALLIGGGGASLTVFDAIRRHGGRPANYCEVGGNPTEEKVAALTALLLSKPGVRQIAVIMNVVNNTRADVMARGILLGIERVGLKPSDAISIFRIPGSWEREAFDLLAAVGVRALGREISLDEAARLAVERSRAHAA